MKRTSRYALTTFATLAPSVIAAVLAAIASLAAVNSAFPPPPPGLKAMAVAEPAPPISSWPQRYTNAIGTVMAAAHLEWPELTNLNYKIEASYDLVQWQTIGTYINTNAGPKTNSLDIIDATTKFWRTRYYRIVPLPGS